MGRIRDLPAFSRPYRHGLRFDDPPAGGTGATGTIDLNDPQVKKQIEAAVVAEREKFQAAEKKLNAVAEGYEQKRVEYEKKLATPVRPQTHQPSREEIADSWAGRVIADFTDEDDFTPAQTKKVMNLFRSGAVELRDASNKAIAKAQEAHTAELTKLRGEIAGYTNDPDRRYRDLEHQNPELGSGEKKVRLADLSPAIKQEAVRIMRDEMDTDVKTATEIAVGRASMGLSVDHEAQKLKDARAAEGLPTSTGGAHVEIDPEDMPLPAKLWEADLEDFFDMVPDTEQATT